MKKLRVGIVGCGGMANGHAREYAKMKGVELVACCDRDAARAADFAQRHGIARSYDDFSRMFAQEDLAAVSNVTSDAAHAPVALAAARAGLHILSEKPLATSVAEGRRMLAAVHKAGVVNVVNFSYRNSAALQAAARLVRSGGIGRVLHAETSYLQSWLSSRIWGDWHDSPGWLWRLSTRHGSLGVLGDIGCHLFDATALLAGDMTRMDCRLKTFDKKVKGNRVGDYVLDANDSLVATVEFAQGAMGVVHTTRWATGHANSLRFRIYGDEGAVEIDLDQSWSEYRVCRGRKAIDHATWKTVKARPIPNLNQRFVRWIRTGEPEASDFANGLKIQYYLQSAVTSSRTERPIVIA